MAELLEREEEYRLGKTIQKMVTLKDKGITLETATKEEKQIFKNAEKAIKIMVNKNIGLVHSGARKFKTHYNTNLEYEDIVQDGMVGLMNAVYKYDPTRGNRFSTVATWWIFQSINRSTNKHSRTVTLPENKIILYGKILEIQNRYEHDNTITQAEIDEIILDELEITNKTLSVIRSTMVTPASLNKVIDSDDSGSKELIDFIDSTDKSSPLLEDSIVQDELLNILQDLLLKLDEKEKDILSASFAVAGLSQEILKPADIREKYNISRAKYNTTLNKILEKVKLELQELGLSFTDFI